LYTDIGLFTDDEAITQDISELFNFLTGYSRQTEYRKLLVSPAKIRTELLRLVQRETKRGKDGRIVWKLNALTDPPIIDALYDASQAGVQVELNVRGVCCLRPGVSGLSENVRVVSIVGRFLEHSRIYYFGNGGKPEAYIGSADMMRRNLDRRIEVLVPVEDDILLTHLHDTILAAFFKDRRRSWLLREDGSYVRLEPEPGSEPFDAQVWFTSHPSTLEVKRSLKVRNI
jgi:polyphosphate kinase